MWNVAAVTVLSVRAASHQLRRAGAVTCRKEGRMAYDRLVDSRVWSLLQEVIAGAP